MFNLSPTNVTRDIGFNFKIALILCLFFSFLLSYIESCPNPQSQIQSLLNKYPDLYGQVFNQNGR